MNKTTRLKKPQIPELETLYTFDELGGRPKYGGVEMTSETDIPSFQEIMDETHSAVVAEATARDDADEALEAEIQELAGQTSEALENEAETRAAADTALREAVNSEASTRGAADNVLQNQIDAIVASSDVKDIVGTKAELDAYDKSTLGDNDIIKVLQDESQSNATTYYRYAEATDSFTLIGAEGPYYTKGQADALLNNKADKATTYTKTEVDATVSNLEADIATKQDQLTAGENITIDNNVISAESGVKKLTVDDYNYTMGSTRGIALWLLEPNVYIADGQLVTFPNNHTSSGAESGTTLIINPYGNTHVTIARFGFPASLVAVCRTRISDGNDDGVFQVVDTLTSTSSGSPLSARQGKLLKDMIGDLANLSTTDKSNLVAAINEVASSVGGRGFTMLTDDDANWTDPDSGDEMIALWLLPTGLYRFSPDATVSAVFALDTDGEETWIEGTTGKESEPIFIIENDTSVQSAAGITMLSASYSGQWIVDNANGLMDQENSGPFRVEPVQTTGTSTTDVMSQGATTSMVYADPETKSKIRIGNMTPFSEGSGAITVRTSGVGATSAGAIAIGNDTQARSNFAIALGTGVDTGENNNAAIGIGFYSGAYAPYAVAMGAGSKARTQGEFSIGDSTRTDMYNGTGYRLLTNVYDPQTDHDAATKGYVDTAIAAAGGAEEISAADWSNLWQ